MSDVDYTIVVDTREQKPLFAPDEDIRKLKKEEQDAIAVKSMAVRNTLKTGDYSIYGFESRIAIERKSVADLFGTVLKGHERFKREIERALSFDYFAIMIDGSYKDILSGNFIQKQNGGKMKGVTVLKVLFTIHTKYNIPIFMNSGRTQSRILVKEIFDSFMRTELKKQKEARKQKKLEVQQNG